MKRITNLRTFRLDTKSAVSSRVSWLIWSTIPTILGLLAAAVAVDCHRRAGSGLRRCDSARATLRVGCEEMRIARAQHRAVAVCGIDIVYRR